MAVAGRDEAEPGHHLVAVARPPGPAWRRSPSRRLAKASVKCSGMCCTTTVPGVSAGKALQHHLEGGGAAGGCADGHDLARRLKLEPPRPAGAASDDRRQARERGRPGAGRGPHRLHQPPRDVGGGDRPTPACTCTSTAPSSSARRAVSLFSGVRELTTTTGIGTVLHQLGQEGEPVHARHLDVEGDHVRLQPHDHVAGDVGIDRRAHHLDVGVATQLLGQDLPHDGGVVDHEDPNHAASARASAGELALEIEPHVGASLVEADPDLGGRRPAIRRSGPGSGQRAPGASREKVSRSPGDLRKDVPADDVRQFAEGVELRLARTSPTRPRRACFPPRPARIGPYTVRTSRPEKGPPKRDLHRGVRGRACRWASFRSDDGSMKPRSSKVRAVARNSRVSSQLLIARPRGLYDGVPEQFRA